MLVAFGFMEYKLLHGITSFRSGHAAFFSSTLRITISLVSLNPYTPVKQNVLKQFEIFERPQHKLQALEIYFLGARN